MGIVDKWTPPQASDQQFRDAGFLKEAREHPHSELGARWVAHFNGIPFSKIPAAWCYAANPHMRAMIDNFAIQAIQSV